MKQCTKCLKFKEESEFNKCAKNLDGLQYRCKECQKNAYYQNHKHYLEYDKQRAEKRIEYRQKYDKQYRKDNRELLNQKQKIYYHNNRDKINGLTSEQRQEKNARIRKWRQANKDKLNMQKRIRRQTDVTFRLSSNISASIHRSLQRGDRWHWETVVNYTLQQLKEHLESQFDENTTWDNYGTYWEIDHILPVNTFNYTSPEDKQFKICWSLANLRPLERIANRSRPKDGSDVPEAVKQKILKGD